jgi:acyl-CoA-binding protein
MTQTDLDIRFHEAYEKASNLSHAIPQDVMLRIYAYYKQATIGNPRYQQIQPNDLVYAFKLNAWTQVSHLTPDMAKEKYIELMK